MLVGVADSPNSRSKGSQLELRASTHMHSHACCQAYAVMSIHRTYQHIGIHHGGGAQPGAVKCLAKHHLRRVCQGAWCQSGGSMLQVSEVRGDHAFATTV